MFKLELKLERKLFSFDASQLSADLLELPPKLTFLEPFIFQVP